MVNDVYANAKIEQNRCFSTIKVAVYRKVQNSKYADCYDRIKTITQINQGVAIPRNKGIKKMEVRLMSKILEGVNFSVSLNEKSF